MLDDRFKWAHSPMLIVRLQQDLWALLLYNTLFEVMDQISVTESEVIALITQGGRVSPSSKVPYNQAYSPRNYGPSKQHDIMEQRV